MGKTKLFEEQYSKFEKDVHVSKNAVKMERMDFRKNLYANVFLVSDVTHQKAWAISCAEQRGVYAYGQTGCLHGSELQPL